MEKIIVNEKNKRRIKRYIKEQSFYGYEEDISLLENGNQLRERLAREVFKG